MRSPLLHEYAMLYGIYIISNPERFFHCCHWFASGGAAAAPVTWEKVFGGEGDVRASSIIQTTDGGYVVLIDTRSLGDSEEWRVRILKLDSQGNL